LDDIHHHQIQIFQPPVYENEDEETIAENEEILVRTRTVKGLELVPMLNFDCVAEQGPICYRRLRHRRLNCRRSTRPRSCLPLGNDRGRQRGSLRFRQAPSDVDSHPYGRVEGTHQRRLV
jgi:hypothetical protein